METILVNANDYENIESFNDLEAVEDNVSKRRRKRITKRRKRRATRLRKRGKSSKAKRVVARGQKRIKRIKRRQKAVKKGARKVGRAAKKVGRAAALAPLIPLKGMMVGALRAKGVKVSMKTRMNTLASKFYNEIVRKKSGYEGLAPIDLDLESVDHVAPLAAGVVTAIIEFIKNSKNKKERGEKLSKVEAQVVKGTEQAEKQLQEKARTEASREVGEKILFDPKSQMTIVLVILGVIVATFVIAKRK